MEDAKYSYRYERCGENLGVNGTPFTKRKREEGGGVGWVWKASIKDLAQEANKVRGAHNWAEIQDVVQRRRTLERQTCMKVSRFAVSAYPKN